MFIKIILVFRRDLGFDSSKGCKFLHIDSLLILNARKSYCFVIKFAVPNSSISLICCIKYYTIHVAIFVSCLISLLLELDLGLISCFWLQSYYGAYLGKRIQTLPLLLQSHALKL